MQMSEPTSGRRSDWKRFLLVAALPGLPLLLLLLLGKGMRHEFGNLEYFSPSGDRITTPINARRLPEFNLIDQHGQNVTRDDLFGNFWLVSFMTTDTFTTPHLATMTRQLLWANWRYRDEPDVGLLCFTLDANHDTPDRLQSYVKQNERYNRFPDKWKFLTGDQSVINRLISDDLGVPRDSTDRFNMATLLLVDDRGYVRQKYLASSEHEIGDAVEDIALLKKRKLEAQKANRERLERPPLPYLGPRDVLHSGSDTPDTLYHSIPKFALTDQNNREYSHRNTEGKVLLVDAFFTTCPTICPVISSQLARVHDRIAIDGLGDKVAIISHTVDPNRDTPERLRQYADRIGADPELWTFLTGPEEDLYPLLQEGYLLTALASDTAAGGFFHSDQILIIDQDKHIRGTYDGTKTSEVDQMLEDVYQLIAQTETLKTSTQ
ncbi:MAG: hypothetical protein CMN34_05175 [Saprospirales bacterium]|nr:hypothetical protein [Saprospirales bacterium]